MQPAPGTCRVNEGGGVGKSEGGGEGGGGLLTSSNKTSFWKLVNKFSISPDGLTFDTPVVLFPELDRFTL